MFKELNESLGKAFRLLEEDDLEIEEIEPEEEEVEVFDEMPEEEFEEEEIEEPTEIEDKVEELESRIEDIEQKLDIRNPESIPETEEELSPEEKFNKKIRDDFFFYSKYPEDIEITEEILNDYECKESYVPSVAVRNMVSRKEVINSLLGR